MSHGVSRSSRPATAQAGLPRWLIWVVAPAALGLIVGLGAALLPWGANLLAFILAGSGLAWVLRVASDWFAERAGPQQGVVLLGSILLGTWMVLAFSAPGPLRRLGFGTVQFARPEPDPYALPPAGTRRPLQALQDPPSSDPIDPVAPLKELVRSGSRATPTAPGVPESAPAAGSRRSGVRSTLRLSSAASVAGDAIVLMFEVRGDGRPVHGTVDFIVGDATVASLPLRVQGDSSQAEYRLVGLEPGLHTVRAVYQGNNSFEPGSSDVLRHRVRAR